MVANKVRTNVYIDSEIKAKAKEIFSRYGFSLSDAVNMFLVQSVFEKGLPFALKIPNEETTKAMEEVKSGEGLEKITFEQLREDMKKCIV
jgi:DNA-damage-inducible protein J